MDYIYFDNAATTAIAPEVKEAMIEAMELFGNPSSTHALGRKTKSAMEAARKNISQIFNVKPSEIFFTSCGSESNNTAIKCAINDLDVSRIISSPIEHASVKNVLASLEDKIKIEKVNIKDCATIDYNHLEQLLSNSDEKTLVSIMHANNEVGTINDIEKIGELCNQYNAYFHTDAVQTTGYLPLNFNNPNIHFASCSAHKFHGPKGVGILYKQENIKVNPLIHGGGQERNTRAGTENVIGIVGFSKALELANGEMQTVYEYLKKIKLYFIEKLKVEIPDVQINGTDEMEKSLPKVLNLHFPNGNQLMNFKLDLANIACSAGSACSSGSTETSHVIKALHGDTPKGVSVRFSFSKYNTLEEVDKCIAELKKLVHSFTKV